MTPRSVKPPREEPGAGALWAVLVALAAARAALAFTPGMWGWGLDSLRFVQPLVGWTLWALACATLVPGVAARLLPAARAAGAAISRGGALPALAAFTLGAALVWLLPDRVLFVGDAILRQGTVEMLSDPRALLPGGPGQVLPLDLLLHFTLPRGLMESGMLDVNTTARLLDAVEAGLLALLALALAQAMALEGGAALAAAAIAFLGGYLGLFTGYDKSYTEMCLIVAAIAAAGLRMAREGRGMLGLGLAVAAGFLVHRTALALLPAAAVAWMLWFRDHRKTWSARRGTVLVALALPALAVALMLPRIVHTILVLDASQHLRAGAAPGADSLGPAFAAVRLADLANFFLLLCPLAAVVPILGFARGRAVWSQAGTWLLLALFIPFAAMTVVLHPRQGLFRDWDVFAAGGLALSILAAWLVGGTLRGAPRRTWLAVATVAAVLAPTLQWLALHTDLERGLRRAEAFAIGPPARSDVERAAIWDYVGTRHFAFERWDPAVAAFEKAVEVAPSMRMFFTLATAEQRAGRPREAQVAYRHSVERDPNALPAWIGLEQVSVQLGDLDESWRAAREVVRLSPADSRWQRLFARLDSARSFRAARPGEGAWRDP